MLQRLRREVAAVLADPLHVPELEQQMREDRGRRYELVTAAPTAFAVCSLSIDIGARHYVRRRSPARHAGTRRHRVTLHSAPRHPSPFEANRVARAWARSPVRTRHSVVCRPAPHQAVPAWSSEAADHSPGRHRKATPNARVSSSDGRLSSWSGAQFVTARHIGGRNVACLWHVPSADASLQWSSVLAIHPNR